MKTLDEVIADLECCGGDFLADALEWLKGYRDHIKLDEIRDRCMTDNDPLDWDVLRQMEGTPVWVEILDRQVLPALSSSWGIATGNPYKSWEGVECWTLVKPHAEFALPVNGYGKTWQAYRKERE